MRAVQSMILFAKRRPWAASLIAVMAVFLLNIARFAVWPPASALARENPRTTAFMDYRKKQWNDAGRTKAVIWTWKPLAAISQNLRKAVVVAEDSTFWDHDGFDFKGMREALSRNIKRMRLAAGGSTITQQLAKNLYFSPKKSLVRKLQEALVAKRLEMALSKERILELYLNCVEWGDGIFGADAAARQYFGVSAAQLTSYQAATLAAMLPAPLSRKPGSPIVRKAAGMIQARMRIE